MKLIYSMRRKPLKCEPPHFESPTDTDVVRPICTISVGNIIAFSSPTELTDVEGDTWGGHVYVCDLDTPWDSHKVTSTAYPVSSLEWDCEGKQLLVATTEGDISVFGQKEYLLNEWTCLYSTNIPGEHIIKSAFFHNGRRIVTVDKKLDALITEKIQMLRSTPTLKGFGGVACEGACSVTASGLICALTGPATGGGSDGARALCTTECLRPTRDHVTDAAIAYKNGNLLVACACRGLGGSGARCVRCYVCCVSRPPGAAPALALQPLPAIYLSDDDTHTPTSLTWCLREDTDSLLVAGATLSLWKCTERAHAVHKLLSKGPLQGSTTPGGGQKTTSDCFNTVVWQKTCMWAVECGPAVCVRSGRLSAAPPHAVLATARHLRLLSRDSHHYLSNTIQVVSHGTPGVAAEVTPAGAATPPKKTKYGPGALSNGSGCALVSCVELSQLGGVVVVIDTHAQLHVYRLPQPWADIPLPLAVQHTTTLLEYSMVSGYDCLDVLMTLKPNIIEPVYERLTESFQRQPQSFQQYYYHSWLKLRIALCRVSLQWQNSGTWLTCLQMAQAVWAAACAALRPDERPDARPDQPHHVIYALIDDHHHDHDKSLVALEAKTEVLSEALPLQPLRLALQRACDTALTALLTLTHHHHQPHGYELCADPSAVLLLRKLVVLARACGRGADALSRTLARLAASNTPKQDLIEECASLAAQSTGPRVWESLPRCSVSAPHGKQWPLYLEYGVEPEALKFIPEAPAYAQCETTPSLAMDSIRYMYLGGGLRPARWRQCARCGARALPAAQPSRHPLQRAYDARFLSNCRCGGKWTLFSNI
ncbi:hypothetical protein O3G_MSEX003371 [Manduca sexta]|uniref:Mediator of RNA polymerase II transcription subunit 16 n=1 Tax=Manduca sexta TaxID=7130 RepID=A0A921YR47_MANSE|nr:hypothetical protein O3G_MSEX003371 [Manduca sexta]